MQRPSRSFCLAAVSFFNEVRAPRIYGYGFYGMQKVLVNVEANRIQGVLSLLSAFAGETCCLPAVQCCCTALLHRGKKSALLLTLQMLSVLIHQHHCRLQIQYIIHDFYRQGRTRRRSKKLFSDLCTQDAFPRFLLLASSTKGSLAHTDKKLATGAATYTRQASLWPTVGAAEAADASADAAPRAAARTAARCSCRSAHLSPCPIPPN